MTEKLAISAHAALRNLYHAGCNTEPLLIWAQGELKKLQEATPGYYYADEVSKLQDRLIAAIKTP